MNFVNLLDGNGIYRYERKNSIPFDCSIAQDVSIIEDVALRVVEENGERILKLVDRNEAADSGNLVMTGLNLTEENAAERVIPSKNKVTYKGIAETEKNPYLLVLSRDVAFFQGIGTYVKTIPLCEGAMLTMLVFGSCVLSMLDGTVLPLQRCCDVNLEGKKPVVFSDGELRRWLEYTKDKECDYTLANDTAFGVHFSLTADGTNVKVMREHSTVFEKGIINKEREKTRERERRIRQREEEERRKKQEAKEAARRKKLAEEKRKQEQEDMERTAGAAAFMAALSELQAN